MGLWHENQSNGFLSGSFNRGHNLNVFPPTFWVRVCRLSNSQCLLRFTALSIQSPPPDEKLQYLHMFRFSVSQSFFMAVLNSLSYRMLLLHQGCSLDFLILLQISFKVLLDFIVVFKLGPMLKLIWKKSWVSVHCLVWLSVRRAVSTDPALKAYPLLVLTTATQLAIVCRSISSTSVWTRAECK